MTTSITEQFGYLSGSLVPEIVLYLPAEFEKNQLATINLPAVAQQVVRDYAKIALDRLRYLKKTYTAPYTPSGAIPTAQAFRDAEAFVLKLPLNRLGLPSINVASDGEVNFDWSNKDGRVDLGFFGDGHYSFYARGKSTESMGDNIAISEAIPSSLLQLTGGVR